MDQTSNNPESQKDGDNQTIINHPKSKEKYDTEELTGNDLDMFMDVSMTISTELGRAEIKLRDLLSLTKGSVVELNKLSGEPLDILANGKLIAYGEVISINGNFGIRITEIASKQDRVKKSQKD